MIKKLHCTHFGIEGSLRRAREAFYWPLMNAEIKDCIAKYSICNAVKPEHPSCHIKCLTDIRQR